MLLFLHSKTFSVVNKQLVDYFKILNSQFSESFSIGNIFPPCPCEKNELKQFTGHCVAMQGNLIILYISLERLERERLAKDIKPLHHRSERQEQECIFFKQTDILMHIISEIEKNRESILKR